jgi:hypothetical protein
VQLLGLGLDLGGLRAVRSLQRVQVALDALSDLLLALVERLPRLPESE